MMQSEQHGPSEDHRPDASPRLVDRASIFTAVLRRQALRREAKLPLLDVRAEYERAVAQAAWRLHVEQHHDRVRAEVLEGLRAEHGGGWGLSIGGRWAVEIMTRQRLEAIFQRR